jgi:hypothetical protein
LGALVALVFFTAPTRAAGIIYVDADATGTGNGSSWEDAYTDLQAALTTATSGDEIWVAEGVYKPTSGTGCAAPRETNDTCKATFLLKDGFELYGGFEGKETNRNERDWGTHPVTLTGDLNNDNIVDDFDQKRNDDVYHVVTIDTGATATLDGIDITYGNADAGYDNSEGHGHGGGLHHKGTKATIRNVIFDNNRSTRGGGMYAAANSEATLENVQFTTNCATGGYDKGGGLLSEESTLNLTDVYFYDNKGDYGAGMYSASSEVDMQRARFESNGGGAYDQGDGGAIYIIDSQVTIDNALFKENKVGPGNFLRGGAIAVEDECELTADCVGYANTSDIVIRDTTFLKNTTDVGTSNQRRGAAIYVNYAKTTGGSLTVVNSSFLGNVAKNAGGDGGAVFIQNTSASFINTIFAANYSKFNGGAIFAHNVAPFKIYNSTFANNQGNSNHVRSSGSTHLYAYNSIFKDGGLGGTYTLDANTITSEDPEFIRDPEDGLDDTWGTADDDYGDLRLQSTSPAIDAGDNTNLPADSEDLDGDIDTTENIPYDLDGNPRVVNGGTSDTVDLGAYEYNDTVDTPSIVEKGANTPNDTTLRTFEDTMTPSSFVVTPNPADGNVSDFKIVNVISGTLYQSDGTTVINSGDFIKADVAEAGLKFKPALHSTTDGQVSVQASTDGSTASGDIVTGTITIIPVNDAPTLNIPAVTVNEDAGPSKQSVTVAAGPTTAVDEKVGQTLTFTTERKSGSLFAGDFKTEPTVSHTSTTELQFEVNTNMNGEATYEVCAFDDGGTANGGVDKTCTDVKITVNAVNDAPTFDEGDGWENTITLDEGDGSKSYLNFVKNMSVGPVDEGSQEKNFVLSPDLALFTTLPAIDKGTGELTFELAEDANGTATVDVKLKDDGGTANGGQDESTVKSFKIKVNAVNDAPTFTSGGNVAVDEDSGAYSAAWATDISEGAANEDTQTLTFEVTNDNSSLFASGSEPSISADGILSFTPADDANGSANITVKLKDDGGTPNGGSDTSTEVKFTITVNAVNDVPSFTPGSDITVDEDSGEYSESAWATAISKGPDNESGQALTFEVTNNTNEALFAVKPAISADGELTFTPAANEHGSATITVKLTDSEGGETATEDFTITVNSINDAPEVIVPPDTQTTDKDTELKLTKKISVKDVDSGTQPVEATLTAEKGTITLKASALGNLSFDMGTGKDDTYVIFTGKVADVDEALSAVVFTPKSGYTGTEAKIDIIINDQGHSGNGGEKQATATINITVGDVVADPNDPPVNKVPAAQTIDKNGTLTLSSGTATELSVSDPDAADNDIKVTLSVGSGTITLGGDTSSLTVSGDGSASVELVGTVTNINTALGGTTFTPPTDYEGTVTFTITTDDQGYVGDDGAKTDTDSFSIIVGNGGGDGGDTNEPPVNTVPGFQTINENTSLTFEAGEATEVSVSDPDAGTNDIQVTLTATQGTITLGDTSGLSSVAGNGSAAIAMLGPITAINAALDGMVFTPTPDFDGAAGFTIKTDDKGHTGDDGNKTDQDDVIIIVNDTDGGGGETITNNPPQNLLPDPQTAYKNYPLTFSAANGNAFGVSDTDAGSNDIKVTMLITNGLVTLSTTNTLSFITGDGDSDGKLAFTGTVDAMNAAFSGMQFTPDVDYTGPATITITTNDQGHTGDDGPKTDEDSLPITVKDEKPPLPPVIADIFKEGYRNSNIAFEPVDFTSRFTDTRGKSLTAIKIMQPLANGALWLARSPVQLGQVIPIEDVADLIYKPVPNTVGYDEFGWNATNGEKYSDNTAVVSLTIKAKPTVSDIGFAGEEDTTIPLSSTAFITGFTDPEGLALKEVKITLLPSSGTLWYSGTVTQTQVVQDEVFPITATGNLFYKPDADVYGEDIFGWNGSNGAAYAASTAKATISITPTQDPPTVSEIKRSAGQYETVTFDVSDFEASFADPDGDSLQTVKIVSLPTLGTLSFDGSEVTAGDEIPLNDIGKLTYTSEQDGEDSFEWNGSDGTDYAAEAADVVITIRPGPPVTVTPTPTSPTTSTPTVTPGPPEEPQLEIRVDSRDTVAPGEEVDYAISYNNSKGTADADNVDIVVTLPNYTTYLSDKSTDGWAEGDTAGTYKYAVGTLAAGDAGDPIHFAVHVDENAPEGEALELLAIIQIQQEEKSRDEKGPTVEREQQFLFLPIILRSSSTAPEEFEPDLAITSFSVTPANPAKGAAAQINATITNQGKAPTGDFWVDLYISPSTPPTKAGSSWSDVCGVDPCDGITWSVKGLSAGESIELTSSAESYYGSYTQWTGGFRISGNHHLYLLADSWNGDDPLGGVHESDESNNLADLAITINESGSGTNPTPTPTPIPDPGDGPDLVVTQFTVSPSDPHVGQDAMITVKVKNQGNVATDSDFWVDFYINPNPVPTTAGSLWYNVSQIDPLRGISWLVRGLAPGEERTLTSTEQSYYQDYTAWWGYFETPGTHDLYIYVDSWNGSDPNGGVDETNESNNRSGPVRISVGEASLLTSMMPHNEHEVSVDDFPARPLPTERP